MMQSKRKCGAVLMCMGVVLMLCALLLVARNVREQAMGEHSAADALTQLQLAMQDKAPDAAILQTAVPGEAMLVQPVILHAEQEWAAEDTALPSALPEITECPAFSEEAMQTPGPQDASASATHRPSNTAETQTAQADPTIPAAQAQPACTAAPVRTAAPEAVLATALPLPGTTLKPGQDSAAAAPCVTAPARPVLPIYTPEPTPEPLFIKNPDMEMPVEEISGNDYIGILEIPSLGLELPVMADWSYPKLRVAPCRYEGSAYSGDLIISGHNYDRHFGGLWKLQVGDEIRFADVDGHKFVYRVCKTETLKKTDVQKMRSGTWDLTLFTCTYGGKNRVTVRCEFMYFG